MHDNEPTPLVIASNRGPVELHADQHGRVVAHRGGGGLIGVLGPALAGRPGTWVSAAMTEQDRAAADGTGLQSVDVGTGRVRLRLLNLDRVEFDGYYRRISTELLWFLHHHMLDLTREPVFDATARSAWQAYRRINHAFARACAEELAPGGTALLQDYHLSLAPRRLRELRPDARIAHFTMVPWAEPAYFRVLPEPEAAELLDGMLGADMLAFLVPRWARAFLACCAASGYEVDTGTGTVLDRSGRRVRIRCFPVGVDPVELRRRAGTADAETHRRHLAGTVGDRRLVVRVDRMEPSKNLLRGLAGFGEFLARAPRRHGRVVHYVLAYSSRERLRPYREYEQAVRQQVAEINDRFGTPDWTPVLLETQNDFARGLAAMSLADVLVVNPLRDGMNLVAKEGPIVSRRDLALVLSSEAGAADDLAEAALMVHPYDVSALAEAIATALDLPAAERAERLARLRKGAGALPPGAWLLRALDELHALDEPGA